MWSMNNTTPCARGVTAGRIWTRSFQSDLKMLQAKIFGQISSNFDCVIVTIATNTQTHLNTVYIFYISRDRDESFRRKKWISEREKKRWNGDLWTDLFRFIHIVNAHKNLCDYFIIICCGEVLWTVCTQNQENRNNLFSNELKFSNDFYEEKKRTFQKL